MNALSDLPPFLRGRLVGVSVSESDELSALGYGADHLREALLQLCRPLVRLGADLAYGGHFRATANAPGPSTNYLRELVELIASEQRDSASPTAPRQVKIGRLYNPQPWPACEGVTARDRARLIDACTIVAIGQAEAGFAPREFVTPPPGWESGSISDLPPEFVLRRAIVLSTLRRRLVEGFGVAEGTRRIEAAVVLGGKVSGYTGILPGIFEETLWALRAGIPVYLVGGFGGAAARMAEFLSTSKSPSFPPEIFQEADANGQPTEYGRLKAAYASLTPEKDWPTPDRAREELEDRLKAVRKDGLAGLNNGLDREENRRLFTTGDALEASGMIVTGLRRRFLDSERPSSRRASTQGRGRTRKPRSK